mgnify:FL=1
MKKVFRGKQLEITVKNPNHVQSGVASLTLNGTAMEGDYIPASKLTACNQIELVLG